MTSRLLLAAILSTSMSSDGTIADERSSVLPNTLTKQEFDQGFELLFDGIALDGWRNGGNWSVENGAIVHDRRGGPLVYVKETLPFDFELRFEWQTEAKADGGILYRPGLCEYQVLANGHADARNPRTATGSLHFCMPPTKDVVRPNGRWNTGRIVCRGSVVQHWVNGTKVVDFDYDDERWKRNVALHRARGGNLAARPTLLRLADDIGVVRYRTIRLRMITEEHDIGHSTLAPPEIDEEVLEAEVEFLEELHRKRATLQPSH